MQLTDKGALSIHNDKWPVSQITMCVEWKNVIKIILYNMRAHRYIVDR